jgi:hypothetical protein
MSRPPDFFLVGAPKAGTSALHSALALHPHLFLSKVKEPKYYMCGDSPPPAYKGPGDAHSNQEWIWQRERYLKLFAKAPVDRAYSNWMHLWMDGLEPRADIVEAVSHEQKRIDAGWAPFWHYSGLGMYGRQLEDLYAHFPREQVLLLRYKDLVESPDQSLNRVFGFLGVETQEIEQIPSDNSRVFVREGVRTKTVGPVIRAGAAVAQFLPPKVWRTLSKPLISQLLKGGDPERPKLTPEQRELLLAPHLEDIELLEKITGESFEQWRTYREGSSFQSRRSLRSETAS